MDKAVQDKANAILKEEKQAALKPYPKVMQITLADGDIQFYTICPKCGMDICAADFCADGPASPEHLVWVCHCGYRLLTKTADAE